MCVRRLRPGSGVFLLALLWLSACVSTGQTGSLEISYANVSSHLIKGRTTAAEVLKFFGSPSLITKNGDAEEVWTYSHPKGQEHSAGYSSDYGGNINLFGGNPSYTSRSSNQSDLVVTFNPNQVVQDYSIVSPQF